MSKTREQYMQLAEDALRMRGDAASAAVYLDLARIAEPAETVTVHGVDGPIVTVTIDAEPVVAASAVAAKMGEAHLLVGAPPGEPRVTSPLGGLWSRVTVNAISRAIWGEQEPSWGDLTALADRNVGDYRETRDYVVASAERVVAMIRGVA